jgi:hypothetical protein
MTQSQNASRKIVDLNQPGCEHWCPNDETLVDFLGLKEYLEATGPGNYTPDEEEYIQQMENHIKTCPRCQQRTSETLHLSENRAYNYVAGALSDEEKSETDKHLEICNFCRVRVKEWEASYFITDELKPAPLEFYEEILRQLDRNNPKHTLVIATIDAKIEKFRS